MHYKSIKKSLIDNFIVAEVNQEVKDIFGLPDDPSVNFTGNDDQMTSIIDGLVDKKDIDKLELILTRISHEKFQFFVENNEAVLKGKALLAFHKGESRLVILYIT